jgi:LacI family transcriptional regulator
LKKKLSIIDIAKQLEISPTTVSFVLNGKAKEKRISDELVERVLKHVEKVGYKPNALAQSLRTGKTKIIGLMVENISDPFFSSIARLIEEKAYESGYKIIYCSTDNNPEKTKELIRMFSDRKVDGYIIAPSEGIEDDVMALIDNGFPVVLFDRFFPKYSTDNVIIDNYQSTYNAVAHLVEKGFKNIAFITLDSLQTQMQDRLRGYEDAIADRKLNHHLKEISFNQSQENTLRHIKAFLELRNDIDAVLFATGYLAISGLRAMKQLNLKMPDDLAIVAFDDYDFFELHSPSISAISQPIEEISEKLITILLNKLNAPSNSKNNQSVVLPASLVIRDSSVNLQNMKL